ncbi:MAG: metallophosphoesterase [Planctomycetota bacterium]
MTVACYILGDVHISQAPSGLPAFLERLAARRPARLVILGDLFEYWIDVASMQHAHRPTLARLRALRAAGWRVDLVRGNREMVAGRMLAKEFGGRIHWPELRFIVAGLRVRVTHGDRLCDDPGHRLLVAGLRGFWFRAWQSCHPPLVQEAVARWMRRASRTQRVARYARGARGARGDGAGRRIDFAPRRLAAALRDTDLLVTGHLHRRARARVGGIEHIRVGHWPGRRGNWVEIDIDGSVRVCQSDFAEVPARCGSG